MIKYSIIKLCIALLYDLYHIFRAFIYYSKVKKQDIKT